MKNINTYLFLAAAIFSMAILNSCKEDDDSNEGPPSISYPTTAAFSSIENTEFKMWTNGAEVNTSGLDYSNYIDETVAVNFLEEEYTGYDLNFTNDSLFFIQEEFIVGYPYYSSNDSLFILTWDTENNDSTIVTTFLGEGTAENFKTTKSFVHQCDVDDNGELLICFYYQRTEWQTLETISEEESVLFSSLDEIQMGDTLIIINQQARFN